ncbi:hypothetical protein FKM82_015498 [Ascaphus truei]
MSFEENMKLLFTLHKNSSKEGIRTFTRHDMNTLVKMCACIFFPPLVLYSVSGIRLRAILSCALLYISFNSTTVRNDFSSQLARPFFLLVCSTYTGIICVWTPGESYLSLLAA